jgi:uncharacterized phage protein gp47/JayE
MRVPDGFCAICLGACACLAVGEFHEAMDPARHEAEAAFAVEALPPEPDHGHRDYDRSVQVQLARAPVLVSATPSSREDLKKFFEDLKKRDGSGRVFHLA